VLIGGATTSVMHTAVKIDPQYPGAVVYVKDASRAVGVAQNLIGLDSREGFIARTKADYVQKREQHANRRSREPLLPLAQVRANRPVLDWSAYTPPKPAFLGVRTFEDYPLAELAERIDWTPFFQAWELRGRYPNILDDPEQGEQARHLFADAQTMLDHLITDRWLTARAVIGFFPRPADRDDDTVLYADEGREQVLMTLHHLRQQGPKPAGKPHYCLADWVAPRESGIADYLGAFAVTAGIGIDERVREFERVHDDYRAILLKALADRLAEAFAECPARTGAPGVLGLRGGRAVDQRRFDRGTILRHPPRARLSGLSRPHREGPALAIAGRGPRRRHPSDRELRDDADGGGERLVFQSPRSALFRCGPAGSGSGGGLRSTQGLDPGGDGKVAGPESGLRAGGIIT
jgi:hypothetical protein